MVRWSQAGGGILTKHYTSRSLRHIVKRRNSDRDIFCKIPDIPWKDNDPDDGLDLDADNDPDEFDVAPDPFDPDPNEENTLLPPTWRNERSLIDQRSCRIPISRYPVWERRVRLVGEARLHLGDCDIHGVARLIPHDVRFTSPPTLSREIVICGSVLARFETGRQGRRQVALPFQRHFTAWPVQDGDAVCAELLSFVGSRICPILVSAPSGRIQRACELKTFFDALVRVFPRPHHNNRCHLR
jgi:hypothetical protein